MPQVQATALPEKKEEKPQATQLDLDEGNPPPPAVLPDAQKTEEQINAENAERMNAQFTQPVRRPVPDDTGALPTERESVPRGPIKRGNTPLRVKGGKQKPDGTWPERVPDEYDVIVNNMIVGRHPDPAQRDKILKAAQ